MEFMLFLHNILKCVSGQKFILALRIPYRRILLKHTVSKLNGHFLDWKQVEIKTEMLNYRNLKKKSF